MNIRGIGQFSAANDLFDGLAVELPWTYMTIIDDFSGGVISDVSYSRNFITSVHDSSVFVILVDD